MGTTGRRRTLKLNTNNKNKTKTKYEQHQKSQGIFFSQKKKNLDPIVWRIHGGIPSLANSRSTVELETINKEDKVCACKSFLKGQAERLARMGIIYQAIV